MASACFILTLAVSDFAPTYAPDLSALRVRKPAEVEEGDVTLKVELTLAPGITGVLNVADVPGVPATVHPAGAEMLSLTPDTGAPVVFVNVAAVSCVERGVNVVTLERFNRGTSYRAATMLACTELVVASLG